MNGVQGTSRKIKSQILQRNRLLARNGIDLKFDEDSIFSSTQFTTKLLITYIEFTTRSFCVDGCCY